MSVLAVAEKDFRDAVRSRLMIVVAVMFVALTGGGVLLATTAGGEASLGILGAIGALRSGTAIFVPIIALGIAYRAIAGEQASGSLKLLLSLPNSRLDVVLGKSRSSSCSCCRRCFWPSSSSASPSASRRSPTRRSLPPSARSASSSCSSSPGRASSS
ncbi:hypothetical protein BRC99_02040 [Halobacteriales archaeon QS_7_69_60]|nr:MAG: hypothetical protein BRC99_02040 [Halobacteriales archaeon QS_7_69_60]